MKICIYGAGAIGGYLAVPLAESGHDVSLIARGAHLAAIRETGLTLIEGDRRRTVKLACSDDPGDLGPQDYVIVTLKAHSIPGVVNQMLPLLNDNTPVVTAQNGIPWWYFYQHDGPLKDYRIECVDPGGRIWSTLGPERAIGCVAYPSCRIVQPGMVEHIDGTRYMLGEPDGRKSSRVAVLAEALRTAGFKAPVRIRIRDDIWLKLWGNATFNPVSILTLATLEQMTTDPAVRQLIGRMMTEAKQIAEKLGVTFPVDVETRIRWGEAVGAHKTSMLQDLESGRSLEIDALVTAVTELGRLVDIATPAIDTVLALAKLRAKPVKNPR
jgi:2-dehydropantoate 2-reductase